MDILDLYINDLRNEIDRLSEYLDQDRLDYSTLYDNISYIRSSLEDALYLKHLLEGDKEMKYTKEFKEQLSLAIQLVKSLQNNNTDYKEIVLKIVESDDRFTDDYRAVISDAIMKDRLF